jgi:hypothetical protein
MPIARVRNLAQYGVISDVDPYSLPTEAFSMAVNARFQNGSVLRAPVFRRVPITLSETDPRFLTASVPITGFDSVIIGYLNGRVSTYSSGVEEDLSIAGYVEIGADTPYTSCRLGDVLYINRADRIPWSLTSTDTDFQALANWDATWRTNILRSCSGALMAFGVTKGATFYPSMVKTSEFAEVNTVPTTWDETDPTANATENTLSEMKSGITDALSLGSVMMVYGLNETWLMQADGSEDVWVNRILFNDAGAISANCVVEVDKKHYVFGLNDLWVHDGNSKKSIADGRVRKFIFRNMNMQLLERCFLVHDDRRKELRFCYVSADQYAEFTTVTSGCNRCAVYNIAEDRWSFDDLPYVYGAAPANVDNTETYASTVLIYSTAGGTYLDQEDSLKKTMLMVGDVNSTDGLSLSLYALDEQGPGSFVNYPVDTVATGPVLLERQGLDMDEVSDLRGYKVISSVYHQARLETDAEPLSFRFGSADYFNQVVDYSDPQTYDGDTLYRLDYNEGGRYLSMQITHDDYHYFELTGFDVDYELTGDH